MATSINFGATAGASSVMTLPQPGYDLTISGPGNITVRNDTTVIPGAPGAIVTGDGLVNPAKLTVSGKVYMASRATLEAACLSIWSTLYGVDPLYVSMSNGTINYKVLFDGVSGEFVRDTGDRWATLTIDLLILNPAADIAT